MTQPRESEPLAPHRAIAGRVRELRTKQGWSAQRLAEELTKVGVSWDRSIVANFENGRRASVSVEEFLALAYVLSVAPIHLLIPTDAPDTTGYRITPEGPPLRSEYVRAWVRGQSPLGTVDPRRFFSEVPPEEWEPPKWSPEWTEFTRAIANKDREDRDNG